MHHDYYFMWCFNPVFYSKFIWKKRRKIILVFWYFLSKITYVWICRQKILKKKNLIIDIVEYKIFWMYASLMRGSRGDGGRTFRDPLSNLPFSAAIKILLSTPLLGKKYRNCTWVFSGIYNPSRMALYGIHTWSH